MIEDHALAGADVRTDATEWNRQVVEALDVPGRQQQAPEQQVELLTLHDAARQQHAPVAQAELEIEQVAEILLLAPHRHVDALRVVAQDVLPVDRGDDRLDLVGGVADRIEAADDRANARTGDRTDGNALALEHLEHADVRATARTASAEHEADAFLRSPGRPRECRGQNRKCDQQSRYGATSIHGVDGLQPGVEGTINVWTRAPARERIRTALATGC